MVVLVVPVTLILLHLCAGAVLALPVLTDAGAGRGHGWGSAAPSLPRRTAQQSTWLVDLLGGGEPRPRQPRQDPEGASWALGGKRGVRAPGEVPLGPLSSPRRPPQAKRNEVQKISPVGLGKGCRFFPDAGLGVLSDLRNFFTELRTNLDSVEALTQEQGATGLHPEQLLALLAKAEARSQAVSGLPSEIPPLSLPMRNLIFGSAPNDQRYANSGLGK